MIRIQNLTKKYGQSLILDHASFVFPDRGLICVLGPSGCGKSTLLNLIAGFDSVYEGKISVHGKVLSEMSASQICAYRRDNIGFVFQNYHLLGGYTALENVQLATDVVGERHAESELRAKALLEKLGLSGKAEQRIETLSGGQKQRLAIARALINNPSVILADEPTGALDRKNSAEIMELLKNLSEERLVIVITHDKKCADYADQIVKICEGKLLSENVLQDSAESVLLQVKDTPKIALWKRAFKNFKVHLKRYLAVALAISMGVLCFAFSLSSGNIMEQSIADFEAKNTAYHNGYIQTSGNEEELLLLLSKDDRIEHVYTQSVLRGISIKIGEQTVDMEEKYPAARAVQQMSYGVMPRRGESEIAISPSLAAKFDKNIQNLIGKTAEVIYGDQTFSLTVSGIFNAVYDDCFVSSDIEQQMMAETEDTPYSVSYDVIRFEDIVSLSESLQEQGISSENASAEVAVFLSTFENLGRLFLTVSGLILAIGIFISTILLVKQQNTRYREVGLLAALGYTKGSIRKILLYENLGLSALSVLCGGLLTILVFLVDGTAGVALVLSAGQIAGILCVTAVLILVISLLSGIKLVSTEPAQALRK